jgi:hypothetical protein
MTGSSWNYGCADEAKNAAVGYCGQADCQTATWVGNGCAALANANNGAWGWSWSGDQGTADYQALSACMQRGGGCRVVAQLCSF